MTTHTEDFKAIKTTEYQDEGEALLAEAIKLARIPLTLDSWNSGHAVLNAAIKEQQVATPCDSDPLDSLSDLIGSAGAESLADEM